MRKRLVGELSHKVIRDKRVLKAIGTIPRHLFLDGVFEQAAYEDRAFPIGHKQTISQPYTVAYMTQLLEISKRQKVMEIGTGSGYQALVLALLGARVFTIERQKALFDFANNMFKSFDISSIRTYFRDGYKGLPEFAPFERIIVTAGAPEVPQKLKEQLALGGIMVIPVGERGHQTMLKITRISDTEWKTEEFANFRFVPFLKGTVGEN